MQHLHTRGFIFLNVVHSKGAYTHTGFLPESDPSPVVEFFTRIGITAAGGQFDLDAARERCLYIVIGSATCMCSNILGENTKKKTPKTILDTSNFSCKMFGRKRLHAF